MSALPRLLRRGPPRQRPGRTQDQPGVDSSSLPSCKCPDPRELTAAVGPGECLRRLWSWGWRRAAPSPRRRRPGRGRLPGRGGAGRRQPARAAAQRGDHAALARRGRGTGGLLVRPRRRSRSRTRRVRPGRRGSRRPAFDHARMASSIAEALARRPAPAPARRGTRKARKTRKTRKRPPSLDGLVGLSLSRRPHDADRPPRRPPGDLLGGRLRLRRGGDQAARARPAAVAGRRPRGLHPRRQTCSFVTWRR